MRVRFKRTETFQYKNFTSSHPPRVKKGFIKGEVLIVLRAKEIFAIKTFISHFIGSERGYPENTILTALSEIKKEN